MPHILSQPEIDAILAYVRREQGPGAGGAKQIEDYDFSAPGRVSKEILRSMHAIHESFLHNIVSTLTGHLRTMVEAELVSVDQMVYQEYLYTLMSPTVLFVFSVAPIGGRGIIEIHPPLVVAMSDRLLGGDGNVATDARELTPVEQAVVRRIMRQLLTSLGEAWAEIQPLELDLRTIERNPQFLQLLSPAETVILVTFEIKFTGTVGLFSICYPLLLLEPLIKQVETQRTSITVKPWDNASGEDPLRRELLGVSVPVAIELGRSEVSVRELLELRAGDLLRLDTRFDEEIQVRVAGRPKFRARPGRRGRNRAVRITGSTGGPIDVGGKRQDAAK